MHCLRAEPGPVMSAPASGVSLAGVGVDRAPPTQQLNVARGMSLFRRDPAYPAVAVFRVVPAYEVFDPCHPSRRVIEWLLWVSRAVLKGSEGTLAVRVVVGDAGTTKGGMYLEPLQSRCER